MRRAWKDSAKAVVPRAWRRWARRLISGAVYEGDYKSWAAAAAASRGYADAAIFEKVLASARAVRDGQAVWERDSVRYFEPAANAPLLAALDRAAAADGGRLHVVDYGGALGSTWWQHRAWLHSLAEVRWSVVEQPHVVEAGRREFTAGPLRFYESIESCCALERPGVLLLSSVLPYLETPRGLLDEIGARAFRHLIVDRTGFVNRGRDRLTVQHVPAAIYEASYPCWFFDRASLLAALAPRWRVVAEWSTDDEVDIDAEHGGLMLERKSP